MALPLKSNAVSLHNELVDRAAGELDSHCCWLDAVAHEINATMTAVAADRSREFLVRDIRECFSDVDPLGNRMLLDRARLLELEPLASLLAEALA